MNQEKKYKVLFIFTIIIFVIIFVIFLKQRTSENKCECNCSKKIEEKFDQVCVSEKLGGLIADLENNINYIDARKITNGKVLNWEVVKNKNIGVYAVIKTDDEIAINDFKKYFSNLNKDYKYTNIYDNWYVFVGNGFNDYDLKELNDCIK